MAAARRLQPHPKLIKSKPFFVGSSVQFRLYRFHISFFFPCAAGVPEDSLPCTLKEKYSNTAGSEFFLACCITDLEMVKHGKKIGVVFAVICTIVGPLVYFFPGGLRTFLDSLVMLIALPVLSAVFGGFFFKYLPKYAAKFIMIFHIVFYGVFLLISPSYSLFGGNDGTIHYLYAVLVLWPIELLIMYLMNRHNKSKYNVEAWVQEDVGAVDLTPWKYRKIASVLILLFLAAVIIVFSPIGIGTWAYDVPF